MKILALFLGKTDKKYVREAIDDYAKRVGFYLPFEMKVIPDLKKSGNLSEEMQKEKEGQLILDQVNKGDQLILLDERGLEFSSLEFSKWIEKKMIAG